MPDPKTTAKSRRRRGRWTAYLGRLGYLIVALLLIGWEVQEGHVYQSDNCDLKTSSPSDSLLMKPMYDRVVRFAKLKGSPQVVTVGIDQDLQFIQTNVCPARAFTAELLKVIAAHGPAAIALDKYYGRSVCSQDDNDESTTQLLSAIGSAGVPVVVGAATQTSNKSNQLSCLADVPQLFTPGPNRPPIPPNVHAGLTRLNENPLKIPLAWDVYAADRSKIQTENSFALETTELVRPGLRQDASFNKLVRSPQQPYADVYPLPIEYKASALLCSANAQEAKSRWHITCPDAAAMPDLKEKVVVVGSESSSDQYSILGQDPYGFQLQGAYIAALLGRAYLRDIPALWFLIPLVLYYAVAEILLPSMEIHRRPVWPLWHIKHAIVWEIGLFCATMLIGFFVPLLFHRFPPLGIMAVMVAIFAPRLLIEAWALINEGMEEKQAEKELSS